jgi:hypothetical protein
MKAASRLFAEVSAKLEDLHSISVEGQRPDNAPDMRRVLQIQLRSGLAALSVTVGDIKQALESSKS